MARDKTRLYFQTHGDPENPAIVISDGLGCDGAFFGDFIEQFEDNTYIVLWNYRGHGQSESPKDKSHLNIDYCVSDLETLMRHLKIRHAIHIGFSLGVQVIIEYALKHPKMTDGLIFISGTAGKVLDTFHNNSMLKSVFPFLYYLLLNKKAEISKIMQNLVSTKFIYTVASLTEIDGRLIKKDVFNRYLKHLSVMDMEAFARLLSSAADHDAWDRIGGLRHPTLIICGTRDTFTPIQVSERMYEIIPGAQLSRIRGATHSLLAEQPELINLRIERFLQEKGFITKTIEDSHTEDRILN